MQAYLDITLLPAPDIGHHFLWEKVFQQIHLGLVEMQEAPGVVPIGLAWPEYDQDTCRLGSKLRLVATTDTVLATFGTPERLKRLTDYVHLTGIRSIPERVTTYARYQRRQAKSSKERLIRRKVKRTGLSLFEAREQLKDFKEQQLPIPFIHMTSHSTGKRFRLFITKEPTTLAIYQGFSSYGLSHQSTIPEF